MAVLRVLAIVFLTGALVTWVYWVRRLADEPLEAAADADGLAAAAIAGDGARGADGSSPGGKPQGASSSPRTFKSNTECEPCHREIFGEWEGDQHALAWFNSPLLPQDPRRVECNNCHAPRPILETGLESLPKIHGGRFEEGVGCIECHANGNRVEGPLPAAGAACNPAYRSTFGESLICAACHAAHGAYGEWKASTWAKKGYTCQACHMPFVDAPVVTGGPPRRRRSHRMRSQRQEEVLQEAVTLDARVAEGGKIEISLANVGAGHNVPGEISNRELFLLTVIRDREGRLAGEHRETFRTVRRDQRSSISSSQLTPGETRPFTYELPVEHGKAVVSLGYKLLYFIPDDRSILVREKEVEF